MTVSAVRSWVIVLMEYFRHFLFPGARRVNGSIREWKHLALLAVLVAAAVLMPLSVSWSEKTQIVGGIIAALINIAVLLVIFERRWERGVAIFLVACAFAAQIWHEFSSDRSQMGAIVYHFLAAVLFAFAVGLILKRIFQRHTIRTDDVIGALCGYILAGGAWANVYAMVYLTHPAAFHITDAVATRLGNWHWQRFLFDYFSVLTLTTLGYSDIAPAGFPVYSLIWLESVFGQFYIAVVVAQLVGLRLAQALKRE
jgi:voltage-gated potassium channel